MSKAKKMVLLTGNCSDKDCTKRSVTADLVSDFWIERCADHRSTTLSLDMRKIGLYVVPSEVTTR